MKRKGIPKTRMGPAEGCWRRPVRMRQGEAKRRALNAAEGSAYRYVSVSLCGIDEAKKGKNKEKEVMPGQMSVIGCNVILRRSRRIP